MAFTYRDMNIVQRQKERISELAFLNNFLNCLTRLHFAGVFLDPKCRQGNCREVTEQKMFYKWNNLQFLMFPPARTQHIDNEQNRQTEKSRRGNSETADQLKTQVWHIGAGADNRRGGTRHKDRKSIQEVMRAHTQGKASWKQQATDCHKLQWKTKTTPQTNMKI